MAIQAANLHSMNIESAASWIRKKDPGSFMGKAEPNLSSEEQMARAFVDNHWPIPSCNLPALVHGDFWPGNLLWNNGELVAVIDWESAGISDPLLDLAITRLDLLWLFGNDAMEQFINIYRSMSPIDLSNLHIGIFGLPPVPMVN